MIFSLKPQALRMIKIKKQKLDGYYNDSKVSDLREN